MVRGVRIAIRESMRSDLTPLTCHIGLDITEKMCEVYAGDVEVTGAVLL